MDVSPSLTGAAEPCLTIALPWQDPAEAFACWAADPHVAWLDSQGCSDTRGRYSYLAVEPFEILRADQHDRFFAALSQGLALFCLPSGPVPFSGGAVGFLGYELGAEERADPAILDGFFGFYDVVLAFDRLLEKAWLISSGLPEPRPARRMERARWRAASIQARLSRWATPVPPAEKLRWAAETSRAQHEARVARAIDYIAAGDICQANITARFLAPRLPGPAASIHMALRADNPAPFGAYLACGKNLAIASVSPERFLSLDAQGGIEARPIKGTAPRGRNPAEDSALAAALLASAKDFSENLMIADLMRNDIGRVAQIGSVHVPELARLESFARVHHLVSSVRGRLAPGLSATDLLRAAFPGGSVTGAPKHRAMQIIRELESSARGPYCGAIAWIGFDGAMDSSIAIRTLAITPDRVIAQAGGGIVADSDPAAEYEEMMVKLRPLLRALGPWAE